MKKRRILGLFSITLALLLLLTSKTNLAGAVIGSANNNISITIFSIFTLLFIGVALVSGNR